VKIRKLEPETYVEPIIPESLVGLRFSVLSYDLDKGEAEVVFNTDEVITLLLDKVSKIEKELSILKGKIGVVV
jgi:hypothetical protein